MDKRCEGCLKVIKLGECMAFTDVKYQHERKGGCYGRVEKAEEMAKMYEDLSKHAKDKYSIVKYRREAERWRKINGQA